MSWLRIDDRVRTHPKIAKAGPAAAWLWFCGICYCREHLTDGFIPKPVVASLAMNLTSPARHAARLVDVGLWEVAEGGFLVHDFLDWNPSRAEVMSLRDRERDKKRTQRGTPERHERDASRVGAGVPARDRAGDAGLGSGSQGLGSEGFQEESARETTAAVNVGGGYRPMNPHSRPTNLVNGAEVRQHGSHAWCSWPARDGLCVPMFLHREFLGKTRRSDAELLAWYPTVAERYQDTDIGEDTLLFWRRQCTAWVGEATQSMVSGSKTGDSRHAAREFMGDRIAQIAAGKER